MGKLREENVPTKIYFINAPNIFHAVHKTRKAAVKPNNAFFSSHSAPFTESQCIQECLTETVKIVVRNKVKHIKHIVLSRDTVTERVNYFASDF